MLTAVELCGFIGMYYEARGALRFYSVSGAYSLSWTGPITGYAAAASMGIPALFAWLLVFLRGRSASRGLGLIIAALPIVAQVLFLARRQIGVELGFATLLAVYFARGTLPRRTLVVGGGAAMALAVVVIAPLRDAAQLGDSYSNRDVMRRVDNHFQRFVGGHSSEYLLRNAVVTVAGHRASGEYYFGAGFYNRLVQESIPTFLVFDSRDKQNLLAHLEGSERLTERLYGWERPRTQWVPGPADVFRELWYAGPLVFLIIGCFFRVLWMSARSGNVLGQSLYSTLIVYGGVTFLNSPGVAFVKGFRTIVVLGTIYTAVLVVQQRRAGS